MIRFYKEKQRKTGLVTNRKKSSSDEMNFRKPVFMRLPSKFVWVLATIWQHFSHHALNNYINGIRKTLLIFSKRWIVRTYTKQEQTCMIKTDLLLSYFTSSLSGFRQFAGRSGDQGSRSSRKPLSVSSRCFGISASRYSK